MGLGEMMKSAVSKSLLLKVNLTFLAIFLLVYSAIVFEPASLYDKSAGSAVHCSLRECITKKVEDRFMRKKAKEVPVIFNRTLHGVHDVKIGMVNMDDTVDWGSVGKTVSVDFERVSENFEWKDLFPEFIDEEEENDGPSCPEIPMPDFSTYDEKEEMDMVVARVPCRQPESGWNRDVFRLQVHLVTVQLAAKRGRRDENGKVRVAVESECRPMMEIFRCDDVVGREGKWWMFEVDGERLEEKMALPIGSCKLALPLWQEGMYCIISCNTL